MIQINSLVLLRIAVIAIIAILQTTGAPVQTTTQAEVSYTTKIYMFRLLDSFFISFMYFDEGMNLHVHMFYAVGVHFLHQLDAKKKEEEKITTKQIEFNKKQL